MCKAAFCARRTGESQETGRQTSQPPHEFDHHAGVVTYNWQETPQPPHRCRDSAGVVTYGVWVSVVSSFGPFLSYGVTPPTVSSFGPLAGPHLAYGEPSGLPV